MAKKEHPEEQIMRALRPAQTGSRSVFSLPQVGPDCRVRSVGPINPPLTVQLMGFTPKRIIFRALQTSRASSRRGGGWRWSEEPRWSC